MKKRLSLIWLIAFIYFSVGNALFHGIVFADFMNSNLNPITQYSGSPKSYSFFLLLTAWANITTGTVFFTIRGFKNKTKYRDGALVGGLIGLIADGTWNLVNQSLISIWPFNLTIGDTVWHVLQGAGGGILVAYLYARFTQKLRTK